MRCVQCRQELPEGSRFCSHCGAKQWEGAQQELEARSVPAPSAPKSEEPTRLRRSPEPEVQEQAPAPKPAPTEAEPPPISEPIAVRLTKGASEETTDAQRFRSEELPPPQMQPVSPAGGDSRFAPPTPATPLPGAERSDAREGNRPERPNPERRSVAAWIVPPLLAIGVAGALIWQVGHERGVSAEAAGIQQAAVDAALGGNYEIAESRLSEALDKRPDDPGIRSDLTTVQTIRRLDTKLTEAQRMLSSADLTGAAQALDSVEQELSTLEGGAYNRLRARFDKLLEKLELADLGSQAGETETLASQEGLVDTGADTASAPASELIALTGAELQAGTGDLHLLEQRLIENGQVFTGSLRNTSSASMTDLLMQYRTYDAGGSLLDQNWIEVTPSLLRAGGIASFSSEIVSDGADTVVVIDSISWYQE